MMNDIRFFPGNKLIEELEEFYISYGNWRAEYPENFRCFSLLKRMAEISLQYGHYLSDSEEQALIQCIRDIKEGLYSGNLKHTQIPISIHQAILSLVGKNSKAKLIAHLVELEYFAQEKQEKWAEQAFQLIRIGIAKVTAQLSEISAHAAAKELAALLTKLTQDPRTEILSTLETILKQHL